MDTGRRTAGRPRLITYAQDDAVLQAWREAQAGGVSRRTFASQRSMNVDELEKLIQRVSKRQAKDHRRS